MPVSRGFLKYDLYVVLYTCYLFDRLFEFLSWIKNSHPFDFCCGTETFLYRNVSLEHCLNS